MFKSTSLTLMACFTLQVAAGVNEWTYSERVDSMTDETKKSLSVQNDAGHELVAYVDSEGDFWLTISLAGPDQFSHERPPMLRVDKYEPRDIADTVKLDALLQRIDAAGSSAPLYVWNPTFVNVHLGAATEGKLQIGKEEHAITQFMNGEKIVVRYWLSTGGYKDTEFTLSGFSDGAPNVFELEQRASGLTEEEILTKLYAVGSVVGMQLCTIRGCKSSEVADELLTSLQRKLPGDFLARFNEGVEFDQTTCEIVSENAANQVRRNPEYCAEEIDAFNAHEREIEELMSQVNR